MTYMQKRNKFKQISTHIIVYTIYVILGSAALVFSHRSWNTTVGHLIIFMSPYIIINAINYGYRLWEEQIHRREKREISHRFPQIDTAD
ncbi:MAG: hypothetical protein R2549_02610 [Candidatus Scalindua sp.]|jgi:hypothetical protein|nr:hypothetical protein [Candidatus Scalindua sp.]